MSGKQLSSLLFVVFALGALGYQATSDSTYFTSFVANAVFRDNFHEVVPGRFFRSAQMTRDAMTRTVREHGIKSVIDLRLQDDEPDEKNVSEAEAVERGGAIYRHIPFSSARVDQRPSLLALITAYRELPLPILVHCSSGTHRTGVASAIWLLDREGRSPEEAAGQLTMKYGFFQPERDIKAFFQKHPTLDHAISGYAAVSHDRQIPFSEWIVTSKLFDPEPSREEAK